VAFCPSLVYLERVRRDPPILDLLRMPVASAPGFHMVHVLQALHSVYYEPLAAVAPSLRDLLAGPAVRKLLFMTTPEVGSVSCQEDTEMVASNCFQAVQCSAG
jgi:hypothetical protein